MNKLFLSLLMSGLLPGFAHAAKPTLLMTGMRFGAPTINNHNTLDTALLDEGDIVFDTSDANFYGFAGGMTWRQFSGSTSAVPTIQRFTSGSGTYTLPTSPSPTWIRIRMIGGGGGGKGGGTSAGNGGNGGDTTFSTLTAGGGDGANDVNGAAGGTPTGGGNVMNASGGRGATGSQNIVNASLGGIGGSGVFGGAGTGGWLSNAAFAGATNTGGGGGGGSSGTSVNGGGGGGSGGYIENIITSPAATYSYSVGVAGSAGSAGTGTNAQNGGAGGSGVIIVEEYY